MYRDANSKFVIAPGQDVYGVLGTSTNRFSDLYLSGNLSDGTNNISVANIASKSEIPDVSHMVTDNTTQTITGAKTIIGSLLVHETENNPENTISLDATNLLLYIQDDVDTTIIKPGRIELRLNNDDSPRVYGNIKLTGSEKTTGYVPAINFTEDYNGTGTVYSIEFPKASGTVALTSDVATKLDATACTYQTTAPTAAATDGGVHIVYLSAEPATKYAGYIYMIAE